MKTNSPAFQVLEMYNEDYKTYDLGHKILKAEHAKAETHFEDTKSAASKSSNKFLQQKLVEAKTEMDRLELLVVTMWELKKKAIKNYVNEQERLTKLGIVVE
jgi:hypothetical protein